MPFLEQLGMQVAGQAANTGLGLLLEKHNDKRQLRQHQQLGEQQLGLNVRQLQAQKEADLQMWRDTNFSAQMEQIKKAGLSPGLIYGMGGAGGTMTGGSGGAVSGPTPPTGGGEIMGLQLMGAQKKLLEAQTQKTQAEAEKVAGPDTGIAVAEQTLRELQAELQTESYIDMRNKIAAETAKIISEARMSDTEATFQHETYAVKAELLDAELIGLNLANELKKVQKTLTEEQTESIIQNVKQRWKDLDLKEGKLDLDKFVHDIADSTKLAVETVSGITKAVLSKSPKTINNTRTINSTRNFN